MSNLEKTLDTTVEYQPEVKKKKVKKRNGSKIAAYIILTIVAIIVLLPFVFAIAASFAENNFTQMVNVGGSKLFANEYKWYKVFDPTCWMAGSAPYNTILQKNGTDKVMFSFNNYIDVFSRTFSDGAFAGQSKILWGFVNTMIDSVPMVVIGVISSTMAAYAIARINFKGKNAIFYILISSMVIPGVLTMIPAYIMYANFYHWTNTPLPVILPGMCGGAMTMFFIRQFYLTFPKELEEAAFIDGLGRWGIFWRIAFPLAKPVIITQMILSFNGAYNDYLNPLIYFGTVDEFKTLQLHLTDFALESKGVTNATRALAGAIISLVPTFVLYMLAQKVFVDGIVMTGVKG